MIMTEFRPAPFQPHPLIRGGHLQTLLSLKAVDAVGLASRPIPVHVSGGDSIVLHDDCPTDWQKSDPSILLIHGLVGCHGANYMVRLARNFYRRGWRVFRMDMRGCGAALEMASGLPHAGRSDDVAAALTEIDRITRDDHVSEINRDSPGDCASDRLGKLNVAAISLGGALTLRMVGRIGSSLDARPEWHDRVGRIAVVAPPIDLIRCATNMNRRLMRPYNRYFIERLIKRVPPRARERADFRAIDLRRPPRTLWAFDDLVTAPMSGFQDARHYYQDSSAIDLLPENPYKTLILAAEDDPVVPAQMFTQIASRLPATTRLHLESTGGHAGFIDRNRECWMDSVIEHWITMDATS